MTWCSRSVLVPDRSRLRSERLARATAPQSTSTPRAKGGETCRQMIEQHPNPACGSDVFVHRDPHLQFEADRLGKHRHQFLEAHRNVLLATANSHAGPQRRELRKIAVAAKTEMVAVVQDLLRPYPGVISTRVGYAGGEVPNATYRNHGNHAEAIEIVFDPQTVSLRKIVGIPFFQIHDPSTLYRQGNDRGASYRSAIFYTCDEQKRIAENTSPMLMILLAFGRARLLPRWHLPDRSGRPSPSIRTI
jgi:methionine-S-sulfoxide reductase